MRNRLLPDSRVAAITTLAALALSVSLTCILPSDSLATSIVSLRPYRWAVPTSKRIVKINESLT